MNFKLYYASGWKLVIPTENGVPILSIFEFFKHEGYIPNYRVKCSDSEIKFCFDFLLGSAAGELRYFLTNLL